MRGAVCIGVAVHAEPACLATTVAFLRAYTDSGVRLVLLPDGPDEPTASALITDPELAAIEQWATPDPRGMAACFNRLATRSQADVVVLLESGAFVGPRWLELLLAALDQPGCGLVGPSTNVSWNEQGIEPHARGDEEGVRRAAATALRRFGTAARTLEPLYSLADFCYAVSRPVIDAIGPAEEAYGVGPCWEMDYNIQAARAGFRGVWVGASYVYRSAPTRRRRVVEAARFEANRRLYQDRFCGLRLRGETTSYRPHCLGDACEHFAPNTLVPSPAPAPASAPTAVRASAGMAEPARIQVTGAAPRAPLVSCIMPTRGRPEYARQAVRYFQRQDYPNTELVIVEDGPPLLGADPPDDPRVRLIASDVPRSIGALRNTACEHARGEVIVQWDDDDWYGTQRLSRQVADIRAGTADITALRDATVFDLERWQFWRFSAQAHRRTFVRDVHGGTLAYRRWVWDRLARYPDRSLAEDAALLDQAVRRGRPVACPQRGRSLRIPASCHQQLAARGRSAHRLRGAARARPAPRGPGLLRRPLSGRASARAGHAPADGQLHHADAGPAEVRTARDPVLPASGLSGEGAGHPRRRPGPGSRPRPGRPQDRVPAP